MFSMKKEREEEKKHTKKLIINEPPSPPPPPPRPLRSNSMAWKLLGPAYMSHVAETFRLCLKCFLYCLLKLIEAK